MPIPQYRQSIKISTLPNNGGANVSFSPLGNRVALSISGSPTVILHAWQEGLGFGQRFADPTTALSATGTSTAWHPSGSYLVVAMQSLPVYESFPITPSGFGPRYPTTPSLTSAPMGVKFSPDGNYLVAAILETGGLVAYAWSTATGMGSKTPINDATIGGGNYNDCDWHVSGSYIAGANLASPYVMTFRWTTLPFGTGAIFANPTTLPTGSAQDVKWSDDGNYIAVGHATTPFITVYPWTSSGYGQKLANPATLPEGQCNNVSWHDDYLYLAINAVPYIVVYRIMNNTLVRQSTPDFYLNGAGLGIAISASGKSMCSVTNTTPFAFGYIKQVLGNLSIGTG